MYFTKDNGLKFHRFLANSFHNTVPQLMMVKEHKTINYAKKPFANHSVQRRNSEDYQ